MTQTNLFKAYRMCPISSHFHSTPSSKCISTPPKGSIRKKLAIIVGGHHPVLDYSCYDFNLSPSSDHRIELRQLSCEFRALIHVPQALTDPPPPVSGSGVQVPWPPVPEGRKMVGQRRAPVHALPVRLRRPQHHRLHPTTVPAGARWLCAKLPRLRVLSLQVHVHVWSGA